MRTKVTIRHGAQFHLYREAFEDSDTDPVYLTLQNIEFECRRGERGSAVTVAIPPQVARALGLPLGRDAADG